MLKVIYIGCDDRIKIVQIQVKSRPVEFCALVENSIPYVKFVIGTWFSWVNVLECSQLDLIDFAQTHIRDSHSQIKINLPHPELLVLLQINVIRNILFVHIWPIYSIWSGAISDGRRDISNRRTNSKFRTTDSKWYAIKWQSVWKARKSNFFLFRSVIT